MTLRKWCNIRLLADIPLYRLGLFLAILLYAFVGTPTPDHFGITELLIAICLFFSLHISTLPRRLFCREKSYIHKSGLVLLLYGLTVPLLAALINGTAPAYILRDMIPFLFLLLPIFLPARPDHAGDITALSIITAVAGLIFALRVLYPLFIGWLETATPSLSPTISDPFYLGNAVIVLYAAIASFGLAGYKALTTRHLTGIITALALLVAGCLPLLTMIFIIQRATIGLWVLSLIFLLGLAFFYRPYRSLAIIIITAGLIAWLSGFIEFISQELIHKTTVVGMNNRLNEARAVSQNLGDGFLGQLFGRGWGARFYSPAAGNSYVNFTHNFFTTYWLKTGLCGVILAGLYIFGFFGALYRLLFKNPLMACALGAPFLIAVTLYANFKSLEFGLLLFLIHLWARYGPPLQWTSGYSKQDKLPLQARKI